ncbi:MAG: YggT family protein [Candidatus Nanopelagicales bacterium]|nr:YggT family protein [Candidatus Nanopelagicales bacterium]
MSIVGQILATVLLLFWLVLIARLVFDMVQLFARSWRPTGFVLVIAEGVFSITDPPLRLLRRVIPPLKFGNVQFDLAFLILLIGVQILMNFARTL